MYTECFCVFIQGVSTGRVLETGVPIPPQAPSGGKETGPKAPTDNSAPGTGTAAQPVVIEPEVPEKDKSGRKSPPGTHVWNDETMELPDTLTITTPSQPDNILKPGVLNLSIRARY